MNRKENVSREVAKYAGVLIESENDHTMDLKDMEAKIKAHPEAKYMLVSHMRGKVCDMDKVKELCDAQGITMIEDCAHSVGVFWDGKHTGHHAVVACFSCQSNKALNSGEGGFLCTGVLTVSVDS
jgi:dTDP-4-amino-4,6-dideoxygalactose transaminase